MATKATSPMRICRNGGPVTKDVYKAYYSAGTAANEDWSAGELLYLDANVIKRIGTFGTAAQIDTDDGGLNGAYRHFIALDDHDASADAKSDYVSVQEVLNDTELEVQLGASSSTAPTVANARTTLASVNVLAIYKSDGSGSSGRDCMAADVDTSSKGVLAVIDFDDDTEWMKSETGVAGTDGTGRKVRCKLIQSVQL